MRSQEYVRLSVSYIRRYSGRPTIVFYNRWMACPVQNTRLKRDLCYDLDIFVDYRFLKENSSLVDMELRSGMADVE